MKKHLITMTDTIAGYDLAAEASWLSPKLMAMGPQSGTTLAIVPICATRPIHRKVLNVINSNWNSKVGNRGLEKLILIFVLSFALAGCTPAATLATPVEVTRVVKQTVMVTQSPVEVEVTRLVVVTTTPVPTPVFEIWTADQVVEAFKSSGLEAENPVVMTKEDYGIAPMGAKVGLHFSIPSLCPTCGGRILAFDNQGNLDISRTYYETLGKQSAAFFSWVFVKDNILVQINGDLPEEQARKYEQTLQELE